MIQAGSTIQSTGSAAETGLSKIGKNEAWIRDYEASVHITPSVATLYDSTPCSTRDVTVESGELLAIAGHGRVNVEFRSNGTISLFDDAR